MRSPLMRAAVAAAIFLAVFATVLAVDPLGESAEQTFTDVTFIVLGLVYVPLAVRTARSVQGRLRMAWSALAIGFGCWLLGEILWVFYQRVLDEAPSPSWADLAYLAYYPWVCAGLLLFPTARTWRSQAQVLLDAVLVTGSFFIVSWLTVLGPIWRAKAPDTLGFVVALAYPIGDVLVATIALLVLIRAPRPLRPTLSLLVAGLTAAALADSLWVYESNTTGYSAGDVPDVIYAANALLVIVALVAGYKTRPGDTAHIAEPTGWVVRSMPLVPFALAALFVGSSRYAGEAIESPVAVTGLLLVSTLVFWQILESVELAKREGQVRTMAGRHAHDLASASRYMAAVLPGDLDGTVRVRSRYLPARLAGGDSFGYMWIDDDHLIVYLVDVSGHGVEPTLLSMSVHNRIRCRSMTASTLLSPEQVLTDLNQRFAMDKNNDQYLTMWYGVYQASSRLLRYAAAGNPPALAFTGEPGVVNAVSLDGAGLPVGMFADTTFTEETYRVPPGAQILLCSNGVLGDRLSFAVFTELCEEVAVAPGWSPNSLVSRLRATANATFDDDCVLVQLTF